MFEEWKESSYEGYLVSTKGRVIGAKGKLIKPQLVSGGYAYINRRSFRFYVHREVAKAFIPTEDLTLEVNHKDLDKTNNNIENLEWCTSAENKAHRFRGTKRGVRQRKGRTNWQANITINDEFIHLGMFENKEDAYEEFYNFYSLYYGVKPW